MSARPYEGTPAFGCDPSKPTNRGGSKLQQRRIPLPPTIPQLFARAMWDPTPTTTTKSQKQLAFALGYPMDWRVERKVEMDSETGKPVINDRIHATGGKRKQVKYLWLHHEAAQKAALQLEQEGTLNPIAIPTTMTEGAKTVNSNTTGSHLLPPTPLYSKGDVVQVLYEGNWWEATVTRRKKQADSFVYGVRYHGNESIQNDIDEGDIRQVEDPAELAVTLGFTSDWKASRRGPRYVFTASTGECFTSKKAAMKLFHELNGRINPDGQQDDVGDPPWRLEGHSLIGRDILWTFEHRASATRSITIEQVGTVVGYIDANDKDKNGDPGFVSESTGKPANLFHVTFPDDPNHPYQQYLLHTQDLEEYEVLDRLVPKDSSATLTSLGDTDAKIPVGKKRDGARNGGDNNSPKTKKKRRRS